MDRHYPFSADNSAQAAAALLASKQLNTLVDMARGTSSEGAQPSNTVKPPKAMADRQRVDCPHCGWASTIRTSVKLSALTRESMHACSNVECGHTFVAYTEIARTLSPSATPNPAINLPLSTHVRRDLLRTQLDHARAAQHETKFTQPTTGELFPAVGSPPPD